MKHSRTQRLAALRRQAHDLLRKGATHVEIAAELGVSRTAVWKWARMDPCHTDDSAVGATPLSPSDMASLPTLIERGAQACGFPSPDWTMARLTVMVELEFGVCLRPERVFHLMGDLVPRPRNVAVALPR